MRRGALPTIALVGLVLLAGCSGGLPGTDRSATTTTAQAQIVGSVSSGGKCVDEPKHGFDIRNEPADGGRSIHVAGNVTVPGAHYSIDGSPTLTTVGPGIYRLDVNTTESEEKPEKMCEAGGIVPYEVTIQVPETDAFELVIRHDGQRVSTVGSGAET
jgi:hypothetical protein